DAAYALRLDGEGPVFTTIDGALRRIDGSVAEVRREAVATGPRIDELVVLAHATAPLPESVMRRGDGAMAALAGGRLLIRSREGRVSSVPARGHRVVAAAIEGWFIDDTRRLLHLSDEGRVLAEWPRRTLPNDAVGWWGACDAPAATEPERPGDACFLDLEGRPRPARLRRWDNQQCGNRVFEYPNRMHDLVTGEIVERDRFGLFGLCGPRGDLVYFTYTSRDSVWLGSSDRGLVRPLPFDTASLIGASDDGELVAAVSRDERDFTVHSVDAGASWRRVEVGDDVQCAARGCFTESEHGYVAVSSLPTLPMAPREPRAAPDFVLGDGWLEPPPFTLSCERSVVAPRSEHITPRAPDRIAVREPDGSVWEATVEGAMLEPLWVLAVGSRVVVVTTNDDRVFRLAPDGVVELRPSTAPVGVCLGGRCDVSSRVVVEASGEVIVAWTGERLVTVRRFDTRGHVLAERRLTTNEYTVYVFASRDGRTRLARLVGLPPYELVPIDPAELPARLMLPPRSAWHPRICRDGEPAGTDFDGLFFVPHGMARLRLTDEGDVCVLGSIGVDGFVARSGKLVRWVRENGRD
ncbi:MAG: hypothetical protein KC586_31535, partial [Myxococcales bacterium]|nr:hypothetical protein [Myxococcales bacterium]